jgi:hypothetical protein
MESTCRAGTSIRSRRQLVTHKIVFSVRARSKCHMHRPPRTMSNTYGISKHDEREIRARDKTCVYCGILMKQYPQAMGASGATTAHFNNEGPFKKKFNVAICCRRCNSSKGTKRLSAWFQAPYCREKKVIEETVSKPVKEYRRLEKMS